MALAPAVGCCSSGRSAQNTSPPPQQLHNMTRLCMFPNEYTRMNTPPESQTAPSKIEPLPGPTERLTHAGPQCGTRFTVNLHIFTAPYVRMDVCTSARRGRMRRVVSVVRNGNSIVARCQTAQRRILFALFRIAVSVQNKTSIGVQSGGGFYLISYTIARDYLRPHKCAHIWHCATSEKHMALHSHGNSHIP